MLSAFVGVGTDVFWLVFNARYFLESLDAKFRFWKNHIFQIFHDPEPLHHDPTKVDKSSDFRDFSVFGIMTGHDTNGIREGYGVGTR